jgi:dTDP-4-amino-4,6-dideoxygalactose transaminase
MYDRLIAPLAPAVRALRRGDDDSCLMYVVKVPAVLREAMRAMMAAAGVATSVHYPSLARHPLFGNKLPGGSCGDQDLSIVTLPTFPDLGEDAQRRVVATLARALEAIPRATGVETASANPASLV